tara:strand:+ start:69 stop:302 length:234 start_codon:yes stop_codon:yes gene_type:complete
MKHKELIVMLEVLSIADDLADLMCEGMTIKNQGAGYRDTDTTINTVNCGREIVDKYLKFHESLNDPKLYEENKKELK